MSTCENFLRSLSLSFVVFQLYKQFLSKDIENVYSFVFWPNFQFEQAVIDEVQLKKPSFSIIFFSVLRYWVIKK